MSGRERNWSIEETILFVAALVLLMAGLVLAFKNQVGAAGSTYAAAIVCLIFVFLTEFESFKAFGVEGRLRGERIKLAMTKAVLDAADLPPAKKQITQAELPLESPRVVIDESWRQLEATANSAMHVFSTSPSDLGVMLQQKKLLPDDKLTLFLNLADVRNEILHSDQVKLNPETAAKYAEISTKLAELIRQRAKQTG